MLLSFYKKKKVRKEEEEDEQYNEDGERGAQFEKRSGRQREVWKKRERMW